MSNQNQNSQNKNFAHQQDGEKPLDVRTISVNALPAGFQTIATAYGDYAKRSFEDTKSFVEKLSNVRSVDRAMGTKRLFRSRTSMLLAREGP